MHSDNLELRRFLIVTAGALVLTFSMSYLGVFAMNLVADNGPLSPLGQSLSVLPNLFFAPYNGLLLPLLSSIGVNIWQIGLIGLLLYALILGLIVFIIPLIPAWPKRIRQWKETGPIKGYVYRRESWVPQYSRVLLLTIVAALIVLLISADVLREEFGLALDSTPSKAFLLFHFLTYESITLTAVAGLIYAVFFTGFLFAGLLGAHIIVFLLQWRLPSLKIPGNRIVPLLYLGGGTLALVLIARFFQLPISPYLLVAAVYVLPLVSKSEGFRTRCIHLIEKLTALLAIVPLVIIWIYTQLTGSTILHIPDSGFFIIVIPIVPAALVIGILLAILGKRQLRKLGKSVDKSALEEPTNIQ